MDDRISVCAVVDGGNAQTHRPLEKVLGERPVISGGDAIKVVAQRTSVWVVPHRGADYDDSPSLLVFRVRDRGKWHDT